jgi:hypothetical protein
VLTFFQNLDPQLSDHDRQVAKRLLLEINNRLRFMVELGLGYLTLDRISSTLSGGETQRIHLTRTLGSNLTASMYLLDEPSVGLHPRDTGRLVKVLKDLRDLGNTVVVVEHEESVIENADYLVDMGPEAGVHGGNVVYSGPYADIAKAAPRKPDHEVHDRGNAHQNARYAPQAKEFLTLKGVRQHNLKNMDVRIPLHCLTVVSGVSGSAAKPPWCATYFTRRSRNTCPKMPGKQPGFRRTGRQRKKSDPCGVHQPKPYREKQPLQPGHLREGLRLYPRTFCQTATFKNSRFSTQTLQFQRRRWPLRDLQRRRRTSDGNAVFGRRPPRMRGVQRPPIPSGSASMCSTKAKAFLMY